MEFVDLSSRPQAPSLADFKALVDQRIVGVGVHWLESERGSEVNSVAAEASPSLGTVSVGRWSYAFLRSSELPSPQVHTVYIALPGSYLFHLFRDLGVMFISQPV